MIDVRIARDAVEFWEDDRMVYDIGGETLNADACIDAWERHLQDTKRWSSPEVLATFCRLARKLMARRCGRMSEADRRLFWGAGQ